MTNDSQLAAELRRMITAQKQREDALFEELRALRAGRGAPTGPSPGHHAMNRAIRGAAGRPTGGEADK